MAGPENQPVSQVKQVSRSDVDERLAALIGNAAAVAAVASAVEGTLGPKGLNCMLVDRFGDVTITNDGSTILEKIDVNHPASRLLIQVAKAQDREIGDGTLPRQARPQIGGLRQGERPAIAARRRDRAAAHDDGGVEEGIFQAKPLDEARRVGLDRDDLADATGLRPRLAGSGSTWFVEGAYPGAGRQVVTTTP